VPAGCRFLVALAALWTAAPPAAAQEPYAQLVAETVPKVETALKLRFRQPVHFEVRSRADMRRMLGEMLDAGHSAPAMASMQTVYRLLGLIPDTLDWRRLQLDLLAEQVVGFYDPHAKVLYLQDSPDDPTLGIVIAHELVHALQDEQVNLDSITRIQGDDDRVLAAMAAMEGQATLVSFEIALGLGSDFPGSDEAIRTSVRSGMDEQPVIATAPLFVREMEIFPYLAGMDFMLRFDRAHPGANPFGAALPTSTAQIEIPALYFGTPRREPLELALPAPDGATLEYDNDFGEFTTRVMLEQLLRDRKRATRASAGWTGDRYALLRTPRGEAFVWLTLWDTPRDAAEFAEAMRRVVSRRDKAWRARRTATVRELVVGGHAAALYEDLPSGDSPPLLDVSAATVR
jgi:hypothetical protein